MARKISKKETDKSVRMGDNRGMNKIPPVPAYKNFLGAYLDHFDITREDAGATIGVQKAAISKMVNEQRGIKPSYAKKLWKSFGLPAEDWQKLYDTPPDAAYIEATRFRSKAGNDNALSPVGVTSIMVRGAVQAGVWCEAIEWNQADWFAITTPIDQKYPGLPKYGLLVRGDSMNRVFPEGCILIVINFADLAKAPSNGDYVTAIRRSASGDEYEATVKALQITDDGQMFLWPKSTNPLFQETIALPRADYEAYGNGHDGQSNGHPDLMIQALVVGSYTPEPKATFP